jgi:DNA-binding NarL/FixJ family response regulator
MKTILIVDDNDSIRRVLRQQLDGKEGLTVCGEAVDGVDAIGKAKSLKPDLILLDLLMPRLNGAEAASVLKQHMPETPIILLTLHGESFQNLAAAVGVDLVVAKSDGIRNLVEHVNRLLQSRASLNQKSKAATP